MKIQPFLCCLSLAAGISTLAQPITEPAPLSVAEKVLTNTATPIIDLTITNRSAKNVAAYSVIIQAINPQGHLGPQITHTAVLAFNPPISNGPYPNGLKSGDGQHTSRLRAVFAPDKQVIKNYRISIDYVLFKDGSTWGADSMKTSLKIAGILKGWQLSNSHLKEVMQTGGVNAVAAELKK
jgi:hypothetical protein